MAETSHLSSDWARISAPTLSQIEALADASFAGLPEAFKRLCEGVVFQVEDFPDEETLNDMECETEFDLLGLFRGRGLTESEHLAETGAQPNMVWLYRRPILDFWAESEDTLGDIITHVLVHEIGHHFGLSDDDMEQIERRAGAQNARDAR
jgi:predicted Zn-dependent protease with MMP-like domain